MERLEVDSEEARASRDRWVEHLRREAADLRRQLADEDDPESHA